ncbi:sensor histidine kinase [Petrocella sp. FN5]|uniref:sensor histidine kinase n=1 Tax=Petrocella sp. FN5 TaxID=3032002 RepID=UPI0023D9C0DD|nr:HAMP domain-containing sensor histidine kinase [Petrocella sp. FN5]MDF1616296.1 HAMP domain-containing sensor histidine kinase [Petrocella sp. FN5]
MKNYIHIYLIVILPFATISEVDFDRKLISIIAMVVVITMAYIRSIYDEHIYNAYADTNQSQNMLLMNAQEGFALHRIILDDSGKPVDYIFLAVNAAFEKITGLKGTDIIGKTVLEVLPNTEDYWIDIYGEVAIERTSRSMVNYSKTFDKYYEIRAYPTEDQEFAVLFMDVTERIHNENKLKYAMKQSDKANQLKNQFLKDINHRLRTPLNGMMGMMQLIDVNEVGQNNRELFEAMVLEMKHTRNIINQISKYIDIQGMEFEYTHHNIYNLVMSELKSLDGEDMDISIEQSEDKDLEIFIEKKVLVSVLRELVINAKNHTRNNKVHIKLQSQRNRENKISYMKIKVIDYGEGIEKDRLKYIFNEFYHHDFIHIYKESDSISIPMCKQMLMCCGGDLIVESVQDYGTTFTMILPVYTIR